jgi:hypothetical protein
MGKVIRTIELAKSTAKIVFFASGFDKTLSITVAFPTVGALALCVAIVLAVILASIVAQMVFYATGSGQISTITVTFPTIVTLSGCHAVTCTSVFITLSTTGVVTNTASKTGTM